MILYVFTAIFKRRLTCCITILLSILLCDTSVTAAELNGAAKALSCRSLRSMARAYMAGGAYSKAQQYAEEAMKLAVVRGVSDKELSLCMGDLSYLYLKQGLLDKAEEKSKMSLKLQEKVYQSDHPYMAHSLRNLCSIYLQQGRGEQALKTIGSALAIISQYHGPDDRVIAPFYVDLAKVLAGMEQMELAEKYFNKALTITRGHYGDDNLNTAKVMLAMAEFYAANGNYEIAEPLSKKSQAIHESVLGRNNHRVTSAWLTMARVYQGKGQCSDAESLVCRAMSSVEKTGDITSVIRLAKQVAEIRSLASKN
jgi:tetratricopeptide (TPR) repeat protein